MLRMEAEERPGEGLGLCYPFRWFVLLNVTTFWKMAIIYNRLSIVCLEEEESTRKRKEGGRRRFGQCKDGSHSHRGPGGEAHVIAREKGGCEDDCLIRLLQRV